MGIYRGAYAPGEKGKRWLYAPQHGGPNGAAILNHCPVYIAHAPTGAGYAVHVARMRGRYVHRGRVPPCGGSRGLKSAYSSPIHPGAGGPFALTAMAYSIINVPGIVPGGPSIHARGRGMWGLKGRGSGVPPFRAVLICAAPMPGAVGLSFDDSSTVPYNSNTVKKNRYTFGPKNGQNGISRKAPNLGEN